VSVRKLDHVNLRTPLLAETCAFFRDLLDMTVTPPPGVPDTCRGAWICDGEGHPAVHLVDASVRIGGDKGGLECERSGTGVLHHVAFECDDYEAMLDRMTGRGLDPRRAEIPEIGLRQLFIKDPNGMLVELNFR
jgi:catechol 2,3-dioxygenase-like lactoylglutathione lyase family enzyme